MVYKGILVWVKNAQKFRELLEEINEEQNLKHNNRLEDITFAPLSRNDEVTVLDYVGRLAYPNQCKDGICELIAFDGNRKDVFEFIDKAKAVELLINAGRTPEIFTFLDGFETRKLIRFQLGETHMHLCPECEEKFATPFGGKGMTQCPHCKTEYSIDEETVVVYKLNKI